MFCHTYNCLLPMSNCLMANVKVLYFLMMFRKEIEMTLENFSRKYLNDPMHQNIFFKITSELNITKNQEFCHSKCLHQFPK